MKNIFLDTRPLDRNVRDHFALTEDIMMENAAAALEKAGTSMLCKKENYIHRPSVLILTGKGNNGADGFALARRLMSHELSVTVCMIEEPASEMCIMQKERADKIGVQYTDLYQLDSFLEDKSFDLELIYDCIYGAGFHGTLPSEAQAAIASVNNVTDVYKIACDIPSGLDAFGNSSGIAFKADETVTMGALKLSLFSDEAKDLTGKITLSGLGISRNNFEYSTEIFPRAFLLEKADSILPARNRQNTNKGTFGHTAIVQGEKKGAAVIAALASENFGSGLTTIVNRNFTEAQSNSAYFELMNSTEFPSNTSSVVLGMGLGQNPQAASTYLDYLEQNPELPCVLDADIVYSEKLLPFLKARSAKTVITPHPKEFAQLLKITELGEYTVSEVIKNRVELCEKFAEAFPGVILLLKGANVLIAHKASPQKPVSLYINTFGTSALSKGGSGDVLSGMIGALLSQHYNPLTAVTTASLVHANLASRVQNDWSLTPQKLIDALSSIQEL